MWTFDYTILREILAEIQTQNSTIEHLLIVAIGLYCIQIIAHFCSRKGVKL